MPRYAKTGRMFRIVEMLRNARAGLHINQIARELECSTRTVRRYLEAIQSEAKYPIYSEQTPRGTVWKMIEESRHASMIPVSSEEIAALILARKIVVGAKVGQASSPVIMHGKAGQASSPVSKVKQASPPVDAIADALDSILQKLESQRAPDFARFVDLLSETIAAAPHGAGSPAGALPHCETVATAIQKRVKIKFDYRDREGEATPGRLVAPLGFVLSQGRAYFIGHCYLRGAIRQFVPERMENVTLTDERVAEDFHFDAKEYAESSFGGFRAEPEDILLEIAPWMAGYFARNARMPQQELFERDGCHYMRFRIGPNWALVWWLSQFGPNIEVLEPQHLREWVADFLAEAAEQYAPGSHGKEA